jgi:hypothetical protein
LLGFEGGMDRDSKKRKFREIAERRTNNALDALRKIGNLSNRQLYDWDESELRLIFRVLKGEIADVEARFAAPGSKGKPRFKLGDA